MDKYLCRIKSLSDVIKILITIFCSGIFTKYFGMSSCLEIIPHCYSQSKYSGIISPKCTYMFSIVLVVFQYYLIRYTPLYMIYIYIYTVYIIHYIAPRKILSTQFSLEYVFLYFTRNKLETSFFPALSECLKYKQRPYVFLLTSAKLCAYISHI